MRGWRYEGDHFVSSDSRAGWSPPVRLLLCMTTASSIIRHKDRRTGKSYAVQVTPECPPEHAMERLVGMAEHDYQKSLPPKQRAVANQDTDFKCPYCKTHDEPTMRLEKVLSGFLFFITTTLIEVFTCRKCEKDFREHQLEWERNQVRRSNWAALQIERFKDGEITDEVRVSLTNAL